MVSYDLRFVAAQRFTITLTGAGVLLLSGLFKETQGGAFIWKGRAKLHPTLGPVSS